MNLLAFALVNLRRRPARSGLTVAAVALGVAGVVALSAIAWGFEASWQKANDARGTDLIVTRMATENAMPSPFAADPVRTALQRLPHVQSAVGLLSEMLTVEDSAPPVFVFGWAYPSYLWEHLRLVDGRWPASDEEQSVLIGSLAAELLHRKTGEDVQIEGRRFRIIGTFESAAVVENGALLMTLAQAQQAVDKPGKVNVLNVKLDATGSGADVEELKQRVKETLPGFFAITSGELVRQNTVVRISKAMSHATILVAAMVGALLIFNTMLMSINERRREFGVLLAIGWQRATVMRLVMQESTVLSLIGGLLGVAGGVALAAGLQQMDLLRGKIDVEFRLPFLLAVVGLSWVLGVVGGLYPSIQAARQQPSHALREE